MREAALNTFLEVARRKSLAAAAAHLNLTPAAVSKQIATLEKDLGTQLMKRSPRGVELTASGSIYLDHAQRIVDAYRDAQAAVSESSSQPSGLLKVVCGTHFGSHFFTPHLAEFLSRYPKLELHVQYTQVMPDLEKEKIDIVAGLAALFLPENWIARSLRRTRQVLCASPGYLKRYGTPRVPEDLLEHRIITHLARKPNNIISFTNGDTIAFKPLLYFNETRAMHTCALQGVGLVQLHDYIVAEDIKSGNLVEVLQDYTEQNQTIAISVAYQQTSHVHINVRTLIDFVVEKVSAQRN